LIASGRTARLVAMSTGKSMEAHERAGRARSPALPAGGWRRRHPPERVRQQGDRAADGVSEAHLTLHIGVSWRSGRGSEIDELVPAESPGILLASRCSGRPVRRSSRGRGGAAWLRHSPAGSCRACVRAAASPWRKVALALNAPLAVLSSASRVFPAPGARDGAIASGRTLVLNDGLIAIRAHSTAAIDARS
jgi:hypothetical protein